MNIRPWGITETDSCIIQRYIINFTLSVCPFVILSVTLWGKSNFIDCYLIRLLFFLLKIPYSKKKSLYNLLGPSICHSWFKIHIYSFMKVLWFSIIYLIFLKNHLVRLSINSFFELCYLWMFSSFFICHPLGVCFFLAQIMHNACTLKLLKQLIHFSALSLEL